MSTAKLCVCLVTQEQQTPGQAWALFHPADAGLPQNPPEITPSMLEFLHPSASAHDFSPFCLS